MAGASDVDEDRIVGEPLELTADDWAEGRASLSGRAPVLFLGTSPRALDRAQRRLELISAGQQRWGDLQRSAERVVGALPSDSEGLRRAQMALRAAEQEANLRRAAAAFRSPPFLDIPEAARQEIVKLVALRDAGELTPDELQQAMAKVLQGSLDEEMVKLKALRDAGKLTDAEFERAAAKRLGHPHESAEREPENAQQERRLDRA